MESETIALISQISTPILTPILTAWWLKHRQVKTEKENIEKIIEDIPNKFMVYVNGTEDMDIEHITKTTRMIKDEYFNSMSIKEVYNIMVNLKDEGRMKITSEKNKSDGSTDYKETRWTTTEGWSEPTRKITREVRKDLNGVTYD